METPVGTLSQGDTPFDRAGAPALAAEEIASGEVVGRYRLHRLLGQGGMGRVYLARDLTLGRSVALKFVRHERVGGAGLEIFLNEARTIAALNHPHIVQLYDVGEHRGAPYLALEYLEGESLKDRCGRERPSADECLRALHAIADALAHAHAAGVVHCDLKPSNVMLARDGRLRVVDFGIARTTRSRAAVAGGTPDWMAPEQWLGEPAAEPADVWALAIIAAQLLAGAHPFGDDAARRRDQALAGGGALHLDPAVVPEAVGTLIARSLERAPAARPSARDWHRLLDELLDGRGALSREDGPFRGLASFDERHARCFFGREPEIDAFVERLRSTALLPVVGPSGAGKSSFVFAGVIPRLRARGRWTILALRPGPDPFDALARRILEAGAGTPGSPAAERRALAGELRATPTLLAARLSTLASATGDQILVAIDQLEELFTHGAPAADVDAFLRLLVGASDDPLEPTRVVLTVRDDFLGRLPGLRSLFVLKRLAGDELRGTITRPLERFGYRFEDEAIAGEMLAEVSADVSAALPLLQFACRALWDARDQERRVVTRATYLRIGGVAGALAAHADGVLAELSPAEQHTARRLLTALVAGTARRQLERAHLLAAVPGGSGVLDRLVAARLVLQRGAQGADAAIVELAHESLLQTWGQLARWLDESREERRLLAELDEAASFWHRRGRHEAETWTAQELAAARQRLARLGLVAPPGTEEFLAAGERRQLRARRRSRLRWTLVAAAAGAVTAISIALAGEFRAQQLAALETNAGLVRANEQLSRARDNLGAIELVLEPFDWIDEAPRAADPGELPALSWRLFAARPGSVHEPGSPLPDEVVRARRLERGGARIDRVEAPGGLAFLRIDGRGRPGEACAPSWIRLQALPGYAVGQREVQPLTIPVPTCRASRAGMVHIPAGPFVYGGPGEPPTRYPDYVEPEQTLDLPAFSIDRTEVSNAAFAPFARLAPVTGYPVPAYPVEGGVEDARRPERPVTAIDAFEAEAFCRFMGKRVPGDHEWTKAARGGLVVDGRRNPWPRRLYPWGPRWEPGCTNIDGPADGFGWVAPVDAYPCGASPYGVLNLAGNVSEWISRTGQTNAWSPLRVVRGGDAESPLELEHASTIFRNQREDRQFRFSIGVRCAVDEVQGGIPWERH
jgi:eukaryotic-like serine/threonine-protein kinase